MYAPGHALAAWRGGRRWWEERVTGILYLVPVPIGNPADITLRALETLRTVDLVAAEDTRHFVTLQRAHGLTARSISLHDHNEPARVPELIALLRQGASVAVVSDAGTPVLSDPGYRLVSATIEAGIAVISLPGASAITTSLAGSALPPVPFRFCGFPPRAAGSRLSFYQGLAADPATLVLFEAPHRLLASLRDAQAALGDRSACLARNLTKPHERYQRGSLATLMAGLEAEGTVRGECTVLIAGVPRTLEREARHGAAEDAAEAATILLAEGAPPRAVTALLTTTFGLSRRTAYEMAHRRRGQK
jgi:16S rRNA (cytidine1402-2'-O)-methyltransferase